MSVNKIRKYVLPYLPYAMIFWFFAKCAEAYRLSPDGEVIHRLMDTVRNLGTTLASPMPSFHLFDLGVGLVGAVIIYGIVWQKKRNAKNWRKDVEYGSARWGVQS